MNTLKTSPTRLIPVPDWPTLHPWPSVAGLRHLIFHAERNGFSRVIRRAGRRVLIDESEFFAWVNEDAHRASETPHPAVQRAEQPTNSAAATRRRRS